MVSLLHRATINEGRTLLAVLQQGHEFFIRIAHNSLLIK